VAAWVLAGAASAEAPSIEGHWVGSISLPGTKLAIDVDFKAQDGGWAGDISIPLQGAKDLPLDKIAVDGTSVSFAIPGIPGDPVFQGTLSADGQKITGGFTQGGGTIPFELARAEKPAAAAQGALAGFDEFVSAAMQAWNVPGLAIAVVKDGEVAYIKGFGQRDVEQKLPVTPKTLFAIGSCTKAFTTFVMGTLRTGQAGVGEAGAGLRPLVQAPRPLGHRADHAARPGEPPVRPTAARRRLANNLGASRESWCGGWPGSAAPTCAKWQYTT
jgi:hypothetical protein